MDFLQSLFLESPGWLAFFSFLLFAAALFARRRMSQTHARRALPAVLLLITALFVVQQLVVTQRERIAQALDAFVEAIARENLAGVARTISSRYDDEDMDQEAIIEYIRQALESVDVYDTRYGRLDIVVNGDQAEMILGAVATVRIQGSPGEYHTARWRIGWVRDADGWRISSIRPELIDAAPIESLSRLLPLIR